MNIPVRTVFFEDFIVRWTRVGGFPPMHPGIAHITKKNTAHLMSLGSVIKGQPAAIHNGRCGAEPIRGAMMSQTGRTMQGTHSVHPFYTWNVVSLTVGVIAHWRYKQFGRVHLPSAQSH